MKRMLLFYCSILILSCSLDDEKKWLNPLDEEGDNYFPPTVTAMADDTVAVYDTVELYAVGKAGNAPVIKYLWSFDKGISWSEENDSAGTLKWSFPLDCEGKNTIWVKAVDSITLESDPDSFCVVVKLYRPIVAIMEDAALPINDSIDITAMGSDTNGVVEKYFWALDGNIFSDTTQTGVIKKAFSDSGIYVIKVKVIDDDGFVSDADDVTITVTVNAPTVKAMDDVAVPINDTMVISAIGTDSNGVIMKYFWALDGWNFDDTTDENFIETAFSDSGVHVVKVKVIDDDGLVSAPDAVTILVTASAPSVKAMADTSVSINDTILISAVGTSSNGTIVKYFWALDGVNFIDTTDTNFILTAFSTSGAHRVKVQVIDNSSLVSAPDAVIITVTLDAPILTPVNDTVVSQSATVTINVTAVDTNTGGAIEKYYWDKNSDGWDDSTDIAQYSFTKSGGGLLSVIWGARDDDGVISTDTFTILFNRAPTSVSMVEPADGDTAVFKEFNLDSCKGSVVMHFTGSDPDGSIDTLTYTLYLGKTIGTIQKVYSGRDTSFEKESLDTATTYFWQVKVHDLFGDSAVKEGKFYTPEVDLTPPVITLKGDNPMLLSLCAAYEEPGATAFDNVDGDISNKIEIGGDSVNTSVPDTTYYVVYSVADSMGNDTSVTRTVIIESYIILEDFETGPKYQTTFGEICNTVTSDSTGYWKAWTDKEVGGDTYFNPDPYSTDPPFDAIVLDGMGNNDSSMGFLILIDNIDDSLDRPYYGFGFNLKKYSEYYDLSGLDSITFDMNADAYLNFLRVEFTDISIDTLPSDSQWGYVGQEITTDFDVWTHFKLVPQDFEGVENSPGDGKTWNDVNENINMIQFVNPAREVFYEQTLYIDNIKIYGDFKNSGLLPNKEY